MAPNSPTLDAPGSELLDLSDVRKLSRLCCPAVPARRVPRISANESADVGGARISSVLVIGAQEPTCLVPAANHGGTVGEVKFRLTGVLSRYASGQKAVFKELVYQ